MFPEQRQRIIRERMRAGQGVKVAELAAEFAVSESTIRRDLRDLVESGLLERTHGGAVPVGTLDEPSIAEKREHNLTEKVAIARVAAAMVQDGESIILDAGTTTLEIARQLRSRQGLTVVTNAYNIVMELAGSGNIEVVVTGGVARGNTMALVGPTAEHMLEGINVDRVFLGTNGVDLTRGLTVPTQAEAMVKRRMVAAARQVVVVADHTKMNKVSFAAIAPIKQMDTLISDTACDPTLVRALNALGIQVLLAE